MILLKLVLCSFLLLALYGCTDNQGMSVKQFDPAQFGLVESALDRPMVERAIQIANTISNETNGFQLVASWQPTKLTTGKAVSVFNFRSENLAESEIIFVPNECKQCVFIQSTVFKEKWLRKYLEPESARLKSDDYVILAFLLLHELGHVHQGEASGAINANSTSYNIDRNDQKEKEIAADEFAASKIREAANKIGTSYAAMQVEIALSNLSLNLAADRLINHFGGSTLNSPDLFWDNGFTHPNFELRVLTVNDLIAQTETSHKLLEDFKNHIVRKSTIISPIM